jgi:transposase
VVAVLVELRLVERRFAAVQVALGGVPVTEAARRCGVSRQTVPAIDHYAAVEDR